MRQLTAFTGKEFMGVRRSGKLLVLAILFVLFGIMNPAIAKLTPWMMEMLSDSLSDAGLTVAEVCVDAMTSWTQFYKNMPLALIAFLLMFCGTLTVEYQKGTLINMITKGLKRWKIIVSKTVTMAVLWTAGYWMSFAVTCAYNAYFWDNGIVHHMVFAACCLWLIGLWLISLMMLASAVFTSSSAVLLSVGCVFLAVYALGLFPDLLRYLPVHLMDSAELLTGVSSAADYLPAVFSTAVLSALNIAGAAACFHKR